MAIEIKIPAVGESINEVQIGDWLKREGDQVEKDENLVVIESEKASVELPAPEAGTLTRILKQKGEMVAVGGVVAEMETGTPPDAKAKSTAPEKRTTKKKPRKAEAAKAPAPESKGPPKSRPAARVMPAAQRLMAERGVSAEEVEPSGPGGRILKEDVQRHFEEREKGRAETKQVEIAVAPAAPGTGDRQEEVVPMSLLRRTVARRLVEAQQTMAMLTTFNEVDMSAVMSLRQTHQEAFQKKHGVKVGFMSFFVKAAVDALGAFPQVNAEVRGTDVVYHNYYDIGVAIGGGKGLVVPVLRHAERMSFAEIEKAIQEFAARAQENKLKPEELQGGTFTISNGGVYGSLLSTPIVNPPQSGILGMHTIQERPVALAGNVVIRPMMYLALSYDHRIVDGREAVGFLKRIKEVVESPARLLLEA